MHSERSYMKNQTDELLSLLKTLVWIPGRLNINILSLFYMLKPNTLTYKTIMYGMDSLRNRRVGYKQNKKDGPTLSLPFSSCSCLLLLFCFLLLDQL